MATIESLPLELILPIVKEAVTFPFTSYYDHIQLLALSRVSSPFDFCAKTLLHEEIIFATKEKAQLWLDSRRSRYIVKSLVFRGVSNYSRSDPLSFATALQIIRAYSLELNTIVVTAPAHYADIIHEPNLKSQFTRTRLSLTLSFIVLLTDIKSLTVAFAPAALTHAPSFQSLRTLKISHLYAGPVEGLLQLMRAAPDELTTLSLPPFRQRSGSAFGNEFRRIAKHLTSLTIFLDDVPNDSPLLTLFKIACRSKVSESSLPISFSSENFSFIFPRPKSWVWTTHPIEPGSSRLIPTPPTRWKRSSRCPNSANWSDSPLI